MKFLYRQFQAKKKEVIEVELDQPAKVKFMTASEFRRYKNARTHNYYGGTFESSPVRFVLPFDSVWTVVVEKGPRRAHVNVKAQCRVLPPDREALSSIAIDAPPSVRDRNLIEANGMEAINASEPTEE